MSWAGTLGPRGFLFRDEAAIVSGEAVLEICVATKKTPGTQGMGRVVQSPIKLTRISENFKFRFVTFR